MRHPDIVDVIQRLAGTLIWSPVCGASWRLLCDGVGGGAWLTAERRIVYGVFERVGVRVREALHECG